MNQSKTSFEPQINLADPRLQKWIRFPTGTKPEEYSGLRRTALQNLVARSKGNIRTVHLKEPGTRRGNKLIWLPSLLSYLHGLAEVQAGDTLTPEQLSALPEGGDEE